MMHCFMRFFCWIGSDNRIEKDIERNKLCPENYKKDAKIEIEIFGPPENEKFSQRRILATTTQPVIKQQKIGMTN
jgi:hypothetical protein